MTAVDRPGGGGAVATERQRAVATCLQLDDATGYHAAEGRDCQPEGADREGGRGGQGTEDGAGSGHPSANWAAGRRSGRVGRCVMELVAGSCGGLSRPVVRAAHDDDLADAGVTQARGDAGIKLLSSSLLWLRTMCVRAPFVRRTKGSVMWWSAGVKA
jgi:hypothetical protein